MWLDLIWKVPLGLLLLAWSWAVLVIVRRDDGQ